MKTILLIAAIVFSTVFSFMLLVSSCLADSSVILAWDKNPEPDIAGYRMHWGTNSGVYRWTNTTTMTNISVTNLTVGRTYFFAVTAYNTSQLQSDYSVEISYFVTNLLAPSKPIGLKVWVAP